MSHLQRSQLQNLAIILQRYPIPRNGLVVYIETSGFNPGSAVIIDHAVCNLVDGAIPADGVVSAGILNWTGLLPDALEMRLATDLERIQTTQRPVSTRPAFPYVMDMLRNSPYDGYETMATAVTTLAAALLQQRPVIGHGLLGFSWPFLKTFLPVGDSDSAYTDLLLENVYDTALIEKASMEGEDWLPEVNLPFSAWQRRVGGYYSKCKWSLRNALFEKYNMSVEPGQMYLAEDMARVNVAILKQWEQAVSG